VVFKKNDFENGEVRFLKKGIVWIGLKINIGAICKAKGF
jgi:hypothetical protein